MTSKQRAYLKGLAMTEDPILQIGKSSLTPEFTASVDEALEARELIKISVLKNCMDDPRAIAEVLAQRTRSEVVQVIGKKIVLFKQAKEDSKITLPNRKGRATDEERVEMVRRAIGGNDHFALSLIEMNEDGYTYTYRTLERMRQENAAADYYFIIGADSLYNFDTWMEPGRICQAAKIVVATRDHTEDESLDYEMQRLSAKYGGVFLKLDSLNIDISSQMLRTWIEENRTIKYYVPDCVIDFIQGNQIYQ